MKRKTANSFAVVVSCALFAGCASVPQEAPITVTVAAPVAQVQFQLEDIVRRNAPASQIESQTGTSMTVKNDCMNLASMDAMKCSLVMMGIGNSGWSGPFHMQHYRFVEIDGKTSVRGHWNWCAVNGFGKENCSAINPAGANAMLRLLEKEQTNSVATSGGM